MIAEPLEGPASGLMAFLHSIRFRITLWFVLILAIVLAGFSLLIYVTQSRDLQLDSLERMQERFRGIEGSFGDEEWRLSDPPVESMLGGVPALQRGDLLLLVGSDGHVLGQWGVETSDSQELAEALLQVGGREVDHGVVERSISVAGADGRMVPTEYLLILTAVRHDNELRGYVVIGSPSDLLRQEHRLGVTLALGSLATLAIAFLGGFWLADRAMRPVAAIAVAARAISESDLSRRLNLRGRDELAALARTFDDMIGRLEAGFERQRRFVADASHELRTPITIINLEVARGLASGPASGDSKRALEVIEVEGGRMSRLVNDLMTLARMDSGQAILHFADLDLGEVALEAIGRLSSLAQNRGVELHAGELPELRVRGDAQYLLLMISNLIENGIKYSGTGQSVRVEASAAGENAVVSVSDTGPGIPPEHLPVIFDRFYRADTSRSQNEREAASPSGSGLGLSIVAWIVQAHHGTIRVVSEVDQGATFIVSLPLG